MLNKILSNKNIKNYVVIFAIEFIIMFVGIALFKLVNMKMGDISFAEFTINKRFIAFLTPLLMVGMGVAIPKYSSSQSEDTKVNIYYTAIIVLTTLFTAFLVLSYVFKGSLSNLVFGDKEHSTMIIAVLFYAYSLIIHACIYNYFRSKFYFAAAGAIQLINLGIWPIVVLLFSNNILIYFMLLSICSIVTVVITHIIFIPVKKISQIDIKSNFYTLFTYGIKRVPGDIILGLFLSVPVFIISNNYGLAQAGSVAFCISLFNITIAITSPINILILPEASKIVSENNIALLSSMKNKLLTIALLMSIGVGFGVFLFGDVVLQLFSIPNPSESFYYLKFIFSGILGYSIFSLLRSVVDAFYSSARISNLIVISFLFFISLSTVFHFLSMFTIANILLAFTVSINLLGLLTFVSVYKIKSH
jgi:O-antigen/teichoic acid export membrane protein